MYFTEVTTWFCYAKQRKNVKVVAVGIGGGIDNNELLEIASGVKENVIHVKDFNKLLGTLAPVMRASCDNSECRFTR